MFPEILALLLSSHVPRNWAPCSIPLIPKIFLTVSTYFSRISLPFSPVRKRPPCHYFKKVPHWGRICGQENSPTIEKQIRRYENFYLLLHNTTRLYLASREYYGKWHLIQNQQRLREIFKKLPVISYRKGKSLKDLLVSVYRAKFWRSYNFQCD